MKNKIKLLVAGMLVLCFVAGCGSGDSTTSIDMEAAGQNTEEQEKQKNIVGGQIKENEPSQSVENTEGIEAELAAYQAEREGGVSSAGEYTMVQLPNEENYNYDIGDISYASGFDSKELNEAFRTAREYLEGTLHLESDVWACVDPRMTALYEDEDKGVAKGYDADNIFLCEYNDNGNWQYLILVREEKGADWEVLYQGSSYKAK